MLSRAGKVGRQLPVRGRSVAEEEEEVGAGELRQDGGTATPSPFGTHPRLPRSAWHRGAPKAAALAGALC